MRNIAALLCGLICSTSLINVAGATTTLTRTYVSGSGKDTNSCTANSPCRTFQKALSLIIPGGEIFVLDSADYGPITINHALSITSEGASAGVLASSGTAITVSAGASDVVNLKGLDLDGGNSATVGIQFSSGAALNIQKSTVRGFASAGISFAPTGSGALFVSDSGVRNNGKNGILVSGGAGISATLSRISASGNGVGVLANGSGVTLTATDVVASNNSYGIGATASAVTVRNSLLSNNAVGIAADQSAVVQVSQSTITANGTGLSATNNAQLLSYANNNVAGNATDGIATSTLALQ